MRNLTHRRQEAQAPGPGSVRGGDAAAGVGETGLRRILAAALPRDQRRAVPFRVGGRICHQQGVLRGAGPRLTRVRPAVCVTATTFPSTAGHDGHRAGRPTR